ncbi:elongation factor P [Blattabacterium cuenoti]|uniref:elongation factor P n=1 Tax=Blattabacterium cuenoti TaxID=1653831 RepID=UPI00163C531E|nr:elongation factor P [Blattabacterium cuenoti]
MLKNKRTKLYVHIQKGLYLKYNNEIYKVIDYMHVKPGKGDAFIRTKLRHVINNNILENNFPSKHRIREVEVKSKIYRFLYKTKNLFYFMNIENYQTITIDNILMKNIEFLKEGMNFYIYFKIENNIKTILCIKMPSTVILQVQETMPVKKGDVIQKSSKIAILETKNKLLVPVFINTGEFIKINTYKKSYIERIITKKIK